LEEAGGMVEKIVNIDNAISAEHARVDMDPHNGRFYIADGTKAKPSTNGTWFRWVLVVRLFAPHVIDLRRVECVCLKSLHFLFTF
jgi:hypothetical protein